MKTLTEKEMYQILKETFLEIANCDLNITDTTSKSDVQSLTASRFRSILSNKLKIEYSPMSEIR